MPLRVINPGSQNLRIRKNYVPLFIDRRGANLHLGGFHFPPNQISLRVVYQTDIGIRPIDHASNASCGIIVTRETGGY